MTPGPARLGLWFALTLALPAVFGLAWLWLVPGGVVARAEADERSAAEQALALAERTLLERLHAAAVTVGLALQLDGERRVVGPFASGVSLAAAGTPPTASIAEQAAIARLDNHAVAEALPFFAHATADGSLTPIGWLRYVEARATDDTAAARDLLQRARSLHDGDRCGPVPFAALALLAEVRLSRATASRPTFSGELAQALQRAPAAAVPIVLDELATITGDELPDDTLLALRAAANAAERHAATPVATAPSSDGDGGVLLPSDDGRVIALPAVLVERARTAAFREVRQREPSLALSVGGGGDAPTRIVTALGEAWHATPTATRTSALLTIAARASLVLALVTLVLGNLLLLRLTRRESQLVRLRADFVDVVSHELRTPLTALSLKAEMLATGDVPPERREHYLRALHHDVLRLTDQVERILDFGRLQNGAPLCRAPVPARTLLANGLRQGRPALRLVAQRVDIDAPRVLPTIVGDVDVLGRALRNLLENAAKYAPPGSTVAVRAFASGDELVVEVADRGPGVPATDRASIFQPFVRGSDAPSGTPGSGLGLALVAAAAMTHGGRVTVHDRPGGGAVFTLTLPAQREEVS